MIGARAHRTMWLSVAREGDGPKFWVDFIPGYRNVIGSETAHRRSAMLHP